MAPEGSRVRTSRLLEIERMRNETQVGLRAMTTEEVWELVGELLEDAELARQALLYGIPMDLGPCSFEVPG